MAVGVVNVDFCKNSTKRLYKKIFDTNEKIFDTNEKNQQKRFENRRKTLFLQMKSNNYLSQAAWGGVICYKSATYEYWVIFGRDFKSWKKRDIHNFNT